MADLERQVDELRPVAFALAYRMLGTVSDAEDIVQESLLRLHRALAAGEHFDSPRGFVATVATRLSIDELRSARARREEYVGKWLPEPIITDSTGDPSQHAEMLDSLSLAMLVLLESLSPEQRAVLLLHDVFDYGYDEIAAILDKSEGTSVNSLRAPGATWSSGDRGFRRPGSSRRSWPTGSSRPPSMATSPSSRRCWPRTSS
jgi:RNA polymerase sigma factor (sigma-70 family)